MSTTISPSNVDNVETAPMTNDPDSSPVEPKSKRRWWAYKRTWFLGLPVLLVTALVGLFIWGEMQPRPPGFAPTNPDEGAIITDQWAQFTIDVNTGRDYALFDLNSGQLVAGDFTTPGWDLAFRKTTVLTNSGTTNPDGPGGAVDLGEVALIDAIVPDPAPFITDGMGGEDSDKPVNSELKHWYTYDFFRHIVNANNNTFLVRTDGDRDALVHFDSYYCDNGDTRCLTLRYRLVPKAADATFAAADESALAG